MVSWEDKEKQPLVSAFPHEGTELEHVTVVPCFVIVVVSSPSFTFTNSVMPLRSSTAVYFFMAERFFFWRRRERKR